ncbi:MAG: MATE family efflux transporter [Lachnospiraceae bacterium]
MIRDLTQDVPAKVLIKYTIPMFIGVAFQQMYNIADSVIAGKYAGEGALAAVGASYPVTMLLMAIAIGSQMGVSVVVSQLFGAKKQKDMKMAISTALIASVILSVGLTIIGLLLSKPVMHMLNTPQDVFEDGTLYLMIYIAGFVFLFMYNITTGIFNSLGDSRTPLYFLIMSSVGNVLLDFLFVAVFMWGVAGVAWATFIAQGAACIFSMLVLRVRLKAVVTQKYRLFDVSLLKKICGIAIPSILQQSFISVGNVIIQIIINGYGSSVIAGYSAAVKLNTFAITSLTTLGNGVSGFTAQNIGAGKSIRVSKGCNAGIVMAVTLACCFFLAYFAGGAGLLEMFMNEDSTELARTTGLDFLRIVSPFYIVISVKLVCDGVLRGSGAMKLFMVSTFTDLLLRVILAFVFSTIWQVTGIWYSWPVGWTIAMVMSYVFFRTGAWQKNKE